MKLIYIERGEFMVHVYATRDRGGRWGYSLHLPRFGYVLFGGRR